MSQFTLEDLNENLATLCFARISCTLSGEMLKRAKIDKDEEGALTDALKNLPNEPADILAAFLSSTVGVWKTIIAIQCNGNFYNCTEDGIGPNDEPIPREMLENVEPLSDYIPNFKDILKFNVHPDVSGRYILWVDDNFGQEEMDKVFSDYEKKYYPPDDVKFTI